MGRIRQQDTEAVYPAEERGWLLDDKIAVICIDPTPDPLQMIQVLLKVCIVQKI